MLQTVRGCKVELFETFRQVKPQQGHKFLTSEKELIERDKGAGGKGSHQTVFFQYKEKFSSNFFLVKKRGQQQLSCHKSKNPSSFVDYQHFKMDDISNLIQQNGWMIKLDLKDAYFCVPIHRNHRKYFRFQWVDSCNEFSCRPFGNGPAPRGFAKLFRLFLVLLGKMGMRLVVYIDDNIIILSQSCTSLLQDRDTITLLLQCLGFVINWAKSQPELTQSIEYLRLPSEFCLNNPSFNRTNKVENIVRKCHSVLNSRSLSICHISEPPHIMSV